MAPRWGGLRPDPYDPDAQDADGDGIVQEGTAWERPAGTRMLMEAGEEIGRGLTADTRPAGVRIVDRDGKDVDYSPTWLRAGGAARVEVQQSPLADHGARSLRERGLPSLRQIIQTDRAVRDQAIILQSERDLVRRRNKLFIGTRIDQFLKDENLDEKDRSKVRAAVLGAAYWGTTLFSFRGMESVSEVLNTWLGGLLDADGTDVFDDLTNQYKEIGRIGVEMAMVALAFKEGASREKVREWTDKCIKQYEKQKIKAGEVADRLKQVMRDALADVLGKFRRNRNDRNAPMEFDVPRGGENAVPEIPAVQAPSGPDKSRWTRIAPAELEMMRRRRDPRTNFMRDTTPEEQRQYDLEGGMNAWRNSFGQSYLIEEAAKTEFDGNYKESRWAAAIIDAIDKSDPVGKKNFDGKQRTYRVDSRQFSVGETVDFPLISSGATTEIVSGFEASNNVLGAGDSRGTYIAFVDAPGIVFPEAQEREFILSGEFKVAKIEPFEPPWENRPGYPVNLRGKRQMVTLEYIGPSKQVQVRSGAGSPDKGVDA